jgi:hypothetical protein
MDMESKDGPGWLAIPGRQRREYLKGELQGVASATGRHILGELAGSGRALCDG